MHYEGMYLGSNVTASSKSDSCSVFEMKNDTGIGTMTLYEVFPGIALSYNDFHMKNCYSEFHSDKDTLFIEHCREGRIEWYMENNTCLYLGAGDLRIDNHGDHNGRFEFPLKHYHGISISICKEKAEKSLKNALGGFSFKLAEFLRQSTKSVDFIAGTVGYESHSKFSAAFKKVMGKSPLEYRKSVV